MQKQTLLIQSSPAASWGRTRGVGCGCVTTTGSRARWTCRTWPGDGASAAWEDHSFFVGVHLGPDGSIACSDDVDMRGDALYLEITGMAPEELFPRLRDAVDA